MHDWQQGIIGDLARGVRGVSYRPEHLLTSFAADAAVLLRSTNIQGGAITFEDVQFVPTFLVSDEQRVSQHDIVVCMSNGSKTLVGKSAPCRKQFRDVLTIGAFCSVFHPQPAANPSFVAHVFNGERFRRSIDITLAGSAINNLRNGDVERFHCLIPKPDEQTRIALVLDTVDEAIAKTEAVIAKLRQVRAGLLHDLLTRGLDAHGQLRDPISHPEQFQPSPLGQIPKEWKPGELGDLVSRDRPIVYGILMPGRGFRDGVPVIKVKDIRDGHIDTSDLLLTDPRIDEAYRRARVRTGDLLFTIRGTVGRMAFVQPELNNANITQDTARVSLDEANPLFVARWLETPVPARFIDVHTIGVAVKGINLGEVRRIPVVVPPKEEQDAIASIISTAEVRIESENGVLECLLKLKSGLMTDLLTGRVRVPEDCWDIGRRKSTSHL